MSCYIKFIITCSYDKSTEIFYKTLKHIDLNNLLIFDLSKAYLLKFEYKYFNIYDNNNKIRASARPPQGIIVVAECIVCSEEENNEIIQFIQSLK